MLRPGTLVMYVAARDHAKGTPLGGNNNEILRWTTTTAPAAATARKLWITGVRIQKGPIARTGQRAASWQRRRVIDPLEMQWVRCVRLRPASSREQHATALAGRYFNRAILMKIKTEGIFPNTMHSVLPVLCNHCSDAPHQEVPGNRRRLKGKPQLFRRRRHHAARPGTLRGCEIAVKAPVQPLELIEPGQFH